MHASQLTHRLTVQGVLEWANRLCLNGRSGQNSIKLTANIVQESVIKNFLETEPQYHG